MDIEERIYDLFDTYGLYDLFDDVDRLYDLFDMVLVDYPTANYVNPVLVKGDEDFQKFAYVTVCEEFPGIVSYFLIAYYNEKTNQFYAVRASNP